MEKAPKKTQSKHFNWSSIAKQENPESVLTNFFQDLYSIPGDQEEATQSERRHWVELWKNLRMDSAGGMLISPKKLQKVLKKLKNGKGSPEQITADVLKALPPECLEKLARSLSMMCWDMTFPEDWLCSLTVMAPKVVGATCLTKFRPIAGLCAMRKVLGYVWLKSLPPLKYESVQTAFVPKTHADAGLFLLLQAAELSREWQREIVVVQLDVKKAFDHVDHRAAFKAMKLQGVSLVFDGIDCCNLEWKLYESALGDGLVEQSSDEQRIASRSAGVSSHLHNDHGTGTARLDKELDNPETGLEAGRLCAGCDLLCGRCGAGCCIDVCCRSDGDRGDRKTERGRSDCWCTENTLDKLPEDGRQKHHGGWTGCVAGGSLGVCGIKGVLGRECKTCDRTQICSSQQMSGEVETCSEIFMAPQIVALEHCKDYNVAGFLLEFECLDDGQGPKRQNCKLECEDGGERYWREEAAVDGIGPVVETLAQNWPSVDREGQLERVDCCQRTCAQLGWSCCQNGPQRNLCEGLEMPRSSMVEMETASLERSRERQMVWSAPTTVQNLQVGRHGCWGGLQISLEMQTVCRNLSKTTRVGCTLLKTVEAGSSLRNVERALYRWSRVPRGPMRVRHDWDGCRGCLVDREKNREREVRRALVTPLSVSSQL